MSWLERLWHLWTVITGGHLPAPPPVPGEPPVPPVTPPVVPPAPAGTVAMQLLEAHNLERSAQLIAPLVLNAQLTLAAQRHADWMTATGQMSHTGESGSSVGDRVALTGYAAASYGENIAEGYRTVRAAMRGWMNSDGHRRNILSTQSNAAGFGVSGHGNRTYWCSVFAAPSHRSADGLGKLVESGVVYASEPEQELANELAAIERLTLIVPASESGVLQQPVTADMVADRLRSCGLVVLPEQVLFLGDIPTVGLYRAQIMVGSEKPTILLRVIPEV